MVQLIRRVGRPAVSLNRHAGVRLLLDEVGLGIAQGEANRSTDMVHLYETAERRAPAASDVQYHGLFPAAPDSLT